MRAMTVVEGGMRVLMCAALAWAAQVAHAEVPQRRGDTFFYSDGRQVRAVDPRGQSGEVQADGSIRYSDGTRVVHDAGSGDIKIERPDGTVRLDSGADARGVPSRNADGNIQYPDGTIVRGADPAGNPGKIHPDGSVSYADGTRVTHDTRSGDTKFVGPDGRVRLVNRGTGTDKSFPAPTGAAGGKPTEGGKPSAGDKPARGDKPAPSKNDGGRNDQARNDANRDKPAKTDKPESGRSDKPDSGKPDKPEKTDKAEKPSKSRTVQGDQAGGTTGQVRPSESDRGGSQDDASSKGAPRTIQRGTGPGGRAGDTTSAGGAPLLNLPANSLVINPASTPGSGARTPVDPFGGKR